MGSVLSTLRERVATDGSFSWNWVSQGFVNGVSLYAALPVLTAVLKRSRVDSSVWRTAVAAGCFLGGYRLLIQLFKKNLLLDGIPEAVKQFAAAAGATGIGLGVDDHFLGSFLVIWWCLRAVRCVLPRSDYAPVAIMSASASVLAPAAFLFQDEHQPQYQAFMEKMAFKMERKTLLEQSVPILRPSVHGWNQWVFCDELNVKFPGSHGTTSCTRAVGSTVVPRIFLMALKMYAPLYLAWSFFKLRLPNQRTLENVARSSLFLTGYTATQYLGVMWWQSTVSPKLTRLQHASFAWLSGLWTLMERKERRPELAIYCSAQALNALYNLGKKRGLYSRTPRYLSYILLCIASGTLAAFNDQHPDFVKRCYGFGDPQQERQLPLPGRQP
jgi:hypothetical protein